MNNYKVYMHISPDGKKYVGITRTSLKKRWCGGYGYKGNPHFSRAIKLYGWENFQHLVLFENLTKDQAEEKEIELIKKYNLTNKRFGYNIEHGGNAPGTHSEETKRKISEANKGPRNPNWGKKGPLARNYGKHPSPEAIEKNRLAHIGQPSYWKGKHISEHTKECISKAQSKRVVCVETGQVFANLIEAAEYAGVSFSRISMVCRHAKRSRSAGGYQWRFEDEDYDASLYAPYEKCKKIYAIYPNGNRKLFDSIKQASIELDINRTYISSVLHERQKTTKGLAFVYAKEVT